MSEESDRMVELLQELGMLKRDSTGETRSDAAARRKRKKEITQEMKQLAIQKKRKQIVPGS
jgi:hypothetical protein